VDRGHANLGAVHGWLAALAAEVDEVHAVTLCTGEVDLPSNVFVHSLGKDMGRGKLGQLLAFKRIVGRLARKHRVDVFFAHMVPRYALLLAPYRLLYRIPTAMWYSHNSADLRLKLALPFVDRFLTVSRDSFPLPSEKCRVVGHGVDTDLFRPGKEMWSRGDGATGRNVGLGTSPSRSGTDAGPDVGAGVRPAPTEGEGQGEGSTHHPSPITHHPPEAPRPVRFLSLGRVSPRKDQDLMVSAANVLVNRWGHHDVEFVIAGGPLVPEDREYFQRLRDRVTELALDQFFQFTGSVPHSHTVRPLQACDFFINMHVEGGLGKAVLEAMSCGKPALVSTPTYYDAFPEYAGTFLFEPRNPEDLAGKLRAAMDMSAEERRATGMRLREWVVREHDVRRQMSRVAQLMRELMGGQGPSSK
jgi:glycosyltransferase involved in cell wall biosynthesis